MRGAPQPVTWSVIRWAINESGYSVGDLDSQIGVQPGTVRNWARGDDQPNWTQLKKFAGLVKRQVAVFFLPEPPSIDAPVLSFRAPPKAQRKKPNPTELRYVREARRLQRVLSWLNHETKEQPVSLPQEAFSASASQAASRVRALLGVGAHEQSSWISTSKAFDEWRNAFESLGVHVFLFSMGGKSCRGFSLWDDYAPVIAANTHWNEAARIFTLFHELGHLATRTNSVCVNPASQLHVSHGDIQERWCETFAASALIPADALRTYLINRFGWTTGEKTFSLDRAKNVASQFKVSLRASVLRLIEIDAATWELYLSIPPVTDEKPKGGGGPARLRYEVREDVWGRQTTNVFLSGIRNDLITHYDAMTYLKVSDRDLAAWEERKSEPAT